MATYNTLTSLLAAIANAIRTKTGDSSTINAQDFPSKIESISSTYKVSIYNGGNGNDFLNITLDTDNNNKKIISGDFKDNTNNSVEGSNDKTTWNTITYSDLTNITYKYIKVNKLVSNKSISYLTIEQS